MKQVTQIFLADSSQDTLELLRDALEPHPDLAIIGSAARGTDAYELLSVLNPDVLVVDFLLPGLDGLSLLRRLKAEGRMPRTIMLSAFLNDRIAQAVSALGVQDYLTKPCRMDTLVGRIQEVVDPNRRRVVREYTPAVKRVLSQFGIMPNLNGRHYLEEAVRRALIDRSVLHGITKILYPDLARFFDTTPYCIEHSMRRAIFNAWKKGSPEKRRLQFDGIFDSFSDAPSNAKFINAIVEFIEIEYEQIDVWKSN